MSWMMMGMSRSLSTATPPTASLNTNGTTAASTAVQTFSMTFSASAEKFIVIGLAGLGLSVAITSVTVDPDVGTTVGLSQVVANNSRVVLYQGVLLSDADTATSATVTITYAGSPGVNTGYAVWLADSLKMSSSTATGSNGTNAVGTSLSTTVATSADGFIIAMGRTSAGNFSNMTGSTETFTTFNTSGSNGAGGFANGVAANASSTVNTNWSSSGTITLVAAAWR